jgi:hypothetical protein
LFSDPQTITVNAVAKAMPRISTNGTSSTYRLADTTFALTISHNETKQQRVQSRARFEQRAIVPDPLTSVNDWESAAFSIVLDRPISGFTQTQLDQMWAGLKAWLDSSAFAKFFNQES